MTAPLWVRAALVGTVGLMLARSIIDGEAILSAFWGFMLALWVVVVVEELRGRGGGAS